ncbi:CDP-glycerol glycerophosphotransferase family protein, partial [Bacillus atrophaeus]|nr:CDP-glycerol glycerophosphotransferase family protein [Bacillus atrophaeus]
MKLLNIWKPKNSRMSTAEYITFDERTILLNIKMNNIFEGFKYENLLFLLSSRWNKEEIILKPLEISASNNEIFIKVIVEKEVFNSEGLWDAFIKLENKEEKFRIYDNTTTKMQTNSTLIKEDL